MIAVPGVVVLIVAPAPDGGGLSTLLLERAVRAASGVTAASAASVEVVDGPEVRARAAEALAQPDCRVLILWPRLARWRDDHLAAAIGDLDAGCVVSVAPLFDGGLYLLALAAMLPEIFALDDSAFVGPRAMGELLGAAGQAGRQVGLLRPERALRSPGDVAAALADPLLDGELRALLAG